MVLPGLCFLLLVLAGVAATDLAFRE